MIVRSCFKGILHDSESKFIPKKVLLCKAKYKKPICMTRRVCKTVERKREVYAKYKHKLHPVVKSINKERKEQIKAANKRFEEKLSTNILRDVKSFCAYARSKTKFHVRPATLVDDLGRLLRSLAEISEEFNKYFASVLRMRM